MLPTALPYHTPAKLSRLFSFGGTEPGRQRRSSNPTPRPPQGGSATSGAWRQGNPAVYQHPKNCTAALDNNKRLWYSIDATDGVWRESDRTSKRANPRGLALFLFLRSTRTAPLRNTYGRSWRTAEMLHPPNPPLLCARACSGPTRGHSTALHPALSLWAGHRPRRAAHTPCLWVCTALPPGSACRLAQGGKRHTTPARPTSRPKRAPGLFSLGPGGLDLCPPVLRCPAQLPRSGHWWGAGRQNVALAPRPLYDSGPGSVGRFQSARAGGPGPLMLLFLHGSACGPGPYWANGARTGWRPRLPAEWLDRTNYWANLGGTAPQPPNKRGSRSNFG